MKQFIFNGRVIDYGLPNTSHAEMARRAGVLTAEGNLIPGAEVFTVTKEGGVLYVLGSQNFGGPLHISQQAIEAVLQFFR